MGTVGISFGSPLAGTGFNVSQTVSQIVANLSSVETPWQTQLNSLETQDTVISSLGTMLSALSTDVSQFTDFEGVLAQKEGSSSDPNVLALTSASSSAVAGTHTIVVNSLASTSSGYLNEITNPSDTLSGSISIQVGTGTAQTVTLDSTDNTISGLASAINNAGIGVTANVITDASGSRLSLVSGTSGASGGLTVTSSIADVTTPAANGTDGFLDYNLATSGANASLTVDNIAVSSASNTVSGVIPGVTFQLLSTSPITNSLPETVQVQIVNDTASVTSALGQFVSDYNTVVSAINTQESNTSSGTPEPLFGTPTLSLLQQQILGAINATSPSGTLAAIPTGGYLAPIANATDTLSGSISIGAGSATPTVIDLSSLAAANQNLAGIASAINGDAIGVTASVVTDASGSKLVFSAANGATLNVTSSVTDGTTPLAYTATGVSDTLTGSLSIAVGSAAPTVFNLSSLPAASQNLNGLVSAINAAGIGISAGIITTASGSSLALTSETSGALSVTSTIADGATTLAYTPQSDVNNLTQLGITVNDDGSLSLNSATLSSELDSDYSGVLGFFQNANSWGVDFSNTLGNLGTSNVTGSLTLALNANKATESSLNQNISTENLRISAEQVSLTLELTSADEILQAIPANLENINELYSAITGYQAPTVA
jgi:flagellar hook-associated protein 2